MEKYASLMPRRALTGSNAANAHRLAWARARFYKARERICKIVPPSESRRHASPGAKPQGSRRAQHGSEYLARHLRHDACRGSSTPEPQAIPPMARFRVLEPLRYEVVTETERGIAMTRILAKLALYALAVVTVVDMARYRRREINRLARKEALTAWEEEGGSLPSPH
jgi:hypothetical protein